MTAFHLVSTVLKNPGDFPLLESIDLSHNPLLCFAFFTKLYDLVLVLKREKAFSPLRSVCLNKCTVNEKCQLSLLKLLSRLGGVQKKPSLLYRKPAAHSLEEPPIAGHHVQFKLHYDDSIELHPPLEACSEMILPAKHIPCKRKKYLNLPNRREKNLSINSTSTAALEPQIATSETPYMGDENINKRLANTVSEV